MHLMYTYASVIPFRNLCSVWPKIIVATRHWNSLVKLAKSRRSSVWRMPQVNHSIPPCEDNTLALRVLGTQTGTPSFCKLALKDIRGGLPQCTTWLIGTIGLSHEWRSKLFVSLSSIWQRIWMEPSNTKQTNDEKNPHSHVITMKPQLLRHPPRNGRAGSATERAERHYSPRFCGPSYPTIRPGSA